VEFVNDREFQHVPGSWITMSADVGVLTAWCVTDNPEHGIFKAEIEMKRTVRFGLEEAAVGAVGGGSAAAGSGSGAGIGAAAVGPKEGGTSGASASGTAQVLEGTALSAVVVGMSVLPTAALAAVAPGAVSEMCAPKAGGAAFGRNNFGAAAAAGAGAAAPASSGMFGMLSAGIGGMFGKAAGAADGGAAEAPGAAAAGVASDAAPAPQIDPAELPPPEFARREGRIEKVVRVPAFGESAASFRPHVIVKWRDTALIGAAGAAASGAAAGAAAAVSGAAGGGKGAAKQKTLFDFFKKKGAAAKDVQMADASKAAEEDAQEVLRSRKQKGTFIEIVYAENGAVLPLAPKVETKRVKVRPPRSQEFRHGVTNESLICETRMEEIEFHVLCTGSSTQAMSRDKALQVSLREKTIHNARNNVVNAAMSKSCSSTSSLATSLPNANKKKQQPENNSSEACRLAFAQASSAVARLATCRQVVDKVYESQESLLFKFLTRCGARITVSAETATADTGRSYDSFRIKYQDVQPDTDSAERAEFLGASGIFELADNGAASRNADSEDAARKKHGPASTLASLDTKSQRFFSSVRHCFLHIYADLDSKIFNKAHRCVFGLYVPRLNHCSLILGGKQPDDFDLETVMCEKLENMLYEKFIPMHQRQLSRDGVSDEGFLQRLECKVTFVKDWAEMAPCAEDLLEQVQEKLGTLIHVVSSNISLKELRGLSQGFLAPGVSPGTTSGEGVSQFVSAAERRARRESLSSKNPLASSSSSAHQVLRQLPFLRQVPVAMACANHEAAKFPERNSSKWFSFALRKFAKGIEQGVAPWWGSMITLSRVTNLPVCNLFNINAGGGTLASSGGGGGTGDGSGGNSGAGGLSIDRQLRVAWDVYFNRIVKSHNLLTWASPRPFPDLGCPALQKDDAVEHDINFIKRLLARQQSFLANSGAGKSGAGTFFFFGFGKVRVAVFALSVLLWGRFRRLQ